MKGIVFNLLERSVANEFGDLVWDQLLEKARLDGAYTSLGSYPDEDLYLLVEAASEKLNLTQDAVVQWFGRSCIPGMAEQFPEFFSAHRCTRDLLLNLNDVIHPEVRKVFPGADVPNFEYDVSPSNHALIMHYRSKRKLCSFALGLIEGAAAYYGERVAYSHPSCMKKGDSMCTFALTFPSSTQR